jgi:hypothetical protein
VKVIVLVWLTITVWVPLEVSRGAVTEELVDDARAESEAAVMPFTAVPGARGIVVSISREVSETEVDWTGLAWVVVVRVTASLEEWVTMMLG